MAGDLADFGRRITQITDGSVTRKMLDKAGMAAKKSALEAAADSLGGDRAFSGMRRKAKLGAGFDNLGDSRIQVNMRPAGLWNLADKGRRASGTIRPRKGGRAVMTPRGPRYSSSYGPSRGLGTLRDAMRDAQRTAPKAATDQFKVELGKIMR